jgi:tetratricopeptide (TPR) repeat protein
MFYSNFYNSRKKNLSSYKPISIAAIIILAIGSAYFTNARCKVWENSETMWTDVINNYPDNWQGYLGRGEFLMNTSKYNINPKPGNLDSAFNDFNRAISKNKDNDPHVYLDRGLIYAMKGMPDSALSDYSRTLKSGYHDFQIYMALGTTYSGMHIYDSAYKYFDIVIKMHGEDAQLLQNRAYTYLMDNKFDESVKDYTRLIDNGGNDASFYFFRGCANHRLENYDAALNDYSKAVKINPNYAQAYSNRSLVFSNSKKYKDALNDILKAQSLGLNVDTDYIARLKTNMQ